MAIFRLVTAAEWASVILEILSLMNLHKPLESQGFELNITYLFTAKQANYKNTQ